MTNQTRVLKRFIPNNYVMIFIITVDDQLFVEVALLIEVPLATEPGISLIILTPMKLL